MMCSQWATSSTCRWSLASANSSALPLMITLLRPLPNWGSHFIVQPYPGVNIDKNSSHHNIDSLSLSISIYICIYIYLHMANHGKNWRCKWLLVNCMLEMISPSGCLLGAPWIGAHRQFQKAHVWRLAGRPRFWFEKWHFKIILSLLRIRAVEPQFCLLVQFPLVCCLTSHFCWSLIIPRSATSFPISL